MKNIVFISVESKLDYKFVKMHASINNMDIMFQLESQRMPQYAPSHVDLTEGTLNINPATAVIKIVIVFVAIWGCIVIFMIAKSETFL